nr:G protein-coupled receptor [Proales similis]
MFAKTMNQSGEPSETILLVKDIAWTFFLPGICLMAFLANALTTYVWFKLEKSKPIYRHIQANSISYLLYTLLCVFVFCMRCGRFCSLEDTYWANFYELVIYNFLTSSLGLFNIMLEISVAIYRYLIVTNKTSAKCVKVHRLIISMLCLSLMLNLPNLFWKKIQMRKDGTFHLVVSQSPLENLIKTWICSVTAFRGLLILLLIFMINLLTSLKFSDYIRNKERISGRLTRGSSEEAANLTVERVCRTAELSREYKARRNMTNMIVWMAVVLLLGHLAQTFSFVVINFLDLPPGFVICYILVSNTLLFTSQGVNIFLFYFFNRHFRVSLKQTLGIRGAV